MEIPRSIEGKYRKLERATKIRLLGAALILGMSFEIKDRMASTETQPIINTTSSGGSDPKRSGQPDTQITPKNVN